MTWNAHHELSVTWSLSHKVELTKQQFIIQWNGIYMIRPGQVLKAQASYRKNLAKCLWFVLPLQCFLLPCMDLNPHGVLPVVCCPRRLGLAYWWFCTLCRYYSVACWSLTTSFWENPKDAGKGKSSQWVELQTVHMAIHFVWKEK